MGRRSGPGGAAHRRECGTAWKPMTVNGIPPLAKAWGVSGEDNYTLFGISNDRKSVYKYTIPNTQECGKGDATLLLLR